MSLAGKIFGGILAFIGFVSDVITMMDTIGMFKNWRNIPNSNDVAQAHVWLFVISSLLIAAGIVIYRKS